MQKLFLPVIDNGGGAVKANWAVCMFNALVAGVFGADVVIERISDSHANRACCRAATLFLATDCTDMLIIDADTLFVPRDIEKILSHDKPLVCGIYPKKSDDAPPCLGPLLTGVPTDDENGLVEMRWAGRGFMRIRREVFEAMKESNGGPALEYHQNGETEHEFFSSGPIEGDVTFVAAGQREWVSEDILFCVRAKALGFPCMVDSRIALMHEGSKVYKFGPDQLVRVDSNITSWRDIHGWFDYEDFYRFLVSEIPDGGSFVEVGCWLGRSIAAFDSFAKEAKKKVWIDAVDTFCGRPENDEHAAILDAHKGSVEHAFIDNMKALGVDVAMFTEGSPAAAILFADGTRDAVFIDADHSEEAVSRDIAAWWPKVKPGGILAGHDYDEPGVNAAVKKAFDGPVMSPSFALISVMGRCWYVRKPWVDEAKEKQAQELLGKCGLAPSVEPV